MCSIFGAFGTEINPGLLRLLQRNAGDRGRDGGRTEEFQLGPFRVILGNWRATPTPEVEKAPLQPYDGLVHNGTIANDRELGGLPGEVDSQVLPRVLDRSSLKAFRDSLQKVRGSYAIATVSEQTRSVFLACNYKPLYFWLSPEETIYFSSMERHFAGLLPFGTRPTKLQPYSVLDLRSRHVLSLREGSPQRAVVIASAGLDSTVVASQLARKGWDVHLLHFQYGCLAQTREEESIVKIAKALGTTYSFLPLDFRTLLQAKSTLLNQDDSAIGGAVEGAEYAIDWVPARNLIMLALSVGYAEANGYHAVALGNNLEESGAYPDNEEEFTHLFNGLLPNATADGYQVEVLSPVGHLMKHEIVKLGLFLGAPFEHTWSCYRGEGVHCGRCGPCFMRRTAFSRNGVEDPVFALEEPK